MASLFKLDSLLDNLTGYLEARIDLAKVELKEQLHLALRRVIVGAVLLIFSTLSLIFISTGLALLLGQWLGAAWLGFVIIALVYLALGVGFYFLKENRAFNRAIARLVQNVTTTPDIEEEAL